MNRFIQIYDNEDDCFFDTVEQLERERKYFRPPPHKERGRDGIIRFVSGFILPLCDIKNLLARPKVIVEENSLLHKIESKSPSLWSDAELALLAEKYHIRHGLIE